MRGFYIYSQRRKILLAAVLWIALGGIVASHAHGLMRRIAEDKLAGFMGGGFTVSIENVYGGFFHDMVLEDVKLVSVRGGNKKAFTIARAEISYQLWQEVVEHLTGLSQDSGKLRSVSLDFREDNPFVRGAVTVSGYQGRIDISGVISPVALKQKKSIAIEGSFLRKGDGRYFCNVLWDGSTRFTGLVDPQGKAAELDVLFSGYATGHAKVKGLVSGDNEVKVYCRADRLNIMGREVIGDSWLVCKYGEDPSLSAKIENLIIDKKPYWDISVEGSYLRKGRTIVIREMKLGNNVELAGKVGIAAPYESELKLGIRALDIAEVAGMIGSASMPLKGHLSGDVSAEGPLLAPKVKGRIVMGESLVGNLSFKSAAASLSGEYPVIKVTDSRIVKEGGSLLLSGEADFSRPGGNKFEGMKLETDDHVAFIYQWEIAKNDDKTLEATNDRFAVSASLSEYGSSGSMPGARPSASGKDQNEVGVKYKVDSSNSLKVERNEERDLVGVEHKVQF